MWFCGFVVCLAVVWFVLLVLRMICLGFDLIFGFGCFVAGSFVACCLVIVLCVFVSCGSAQDYGFWRFWWVWVGVCTYVFVWLCFVRF